LIFGHCYFSLDNMSAYICAECGKEIYVSNASEE
jgi:YgiT-type zinc finger domain-containing protein